MSTPFKMKGSPMKRNFGIGASPAKQKSHPAGTGLQNLINLKQDKAKKKNVSSKSHALIPLVGFVGDTLAKTKKKDSKKINWSGTLKSDPHMVNTKLKIIKLKEKNNPGTSWTWDPKTNTPKQIKK